MTTPSPTLNITQQEQSLNSQIGPAGTTSSTTGTDFGLGDWGAANINPGDLPILPALIGTGQATTGNNIVQAFASSDPGSVAQIQRALYLGGYYSSDYTPTYGVIKPQDITAFGNAVQVAGQAKTSVSQVLLTGAQYGTAAGVAAAASQGTQAKVAAVKLPNTQDLEAEAVNAFEEELGRKATPSEAAAFAASYRAMSAGMQRMNNQSVYDAQTGSGGITNTQADQLQNETASAGQPATLAPITGVPGMPPPNDQMISNDTATTPDFSQELSTLGDVAAQAQQDAVPSTGTQTSGLTQVDEEAPPSAEVAAENYAQNTHPQAAGANSIAEQFNTFLSLLAGNFGSGVPGGAQS